MAQEEVAMGQSSLLGVGIPGRIRTWLAEQDRYYQTDIVDDYNDRMVKCTGPCGRTVRLSFGAISGYKYLCQQCRAKNRRRKGNAVSK